MMTIFRHLNNLQMALNHDLIIVFMKVIFSSSTGGINSPQNMMQAEH